MAPRSVLELARAQYGAVSRRQALAAGVSSSGIARRLERGEWRAVDDGVYLVPGARKSWLQQVAVATLATGGIASHLTAARLWKLALPPAAAHAPIDVLVEAARRPRSTSRIRVHRTRAELPAAPRVVRGIPTAELIPTLLQLSEVLDQRRLQRALASAVKLRPGLRRRLSALLSGPQRGHWASLKLRALLSAGG